MASATRSSAVVAEACPRCGKQLTDAAGLGWCPACGYCRTLEETAGKTEAGKEAPEQELPARPAWHQLPDAGKSRGFPLWPIPLLLGMAAIVGLALYIDRKLPPNSLPRALWTSIQIGAGVLILLLGQFFALMKLAHEDGKLAFKDAILPFRLYGLVFERLPRLQFAVWTLGWGLAAIVSAAVLIGGLNHWFTYLKNNKNPNPPVIRKT